MNGFRGRSSAASKARYGEAQLGLLEKLNRADRAHLARLPTLVVPVDWRTDELAYSPLPTRFEASVKWPTYLVVYVPGQVFGGYAYGALVRAIAVVADRRGGSARAGRWIVVSR